MTFTAGTKVRASDLNDLADEGSATYEYANLSTTINNLAVITFTAMLDGSSNSCGVAFVAPPSGQVVIRWGANIVSGTTSSTVLTGTAVRQGATIGSGTIVDDVADADCFEVNSTTRVPGQRERQVDGLTAGNSYNARISWRNSGSTTSTANKPWISVTPVPA
ncbi:MAG TPA: hypothetical protein VFW65_34725 [Pseudonocardiaceae bacterium]|nr:hypothetical protein [Pseudonocardiaceae bacterium]